MIKLNKLNKPQILEDKKEIWDTLFKAYLDNDKSIAKSIGTKYSHTDIKNTLVRETHGKCAYCESKIQHISFGDIEHILPKSKFPEKIFEWSNLTLACTICNNNKRNYYEYDNQIIDPYIDEPSDHHYYCGSLFVDTTNKGYITKVKLDLNRIELVEERTRHLNLLTSFTNLILKAEDEMLRRALLEDLELKSRENEPFSKMVKEFIEHFKFKNTQIITRTEEAT